MAFEDGPVMETEREPEATTFWSDVVVGRPENRMTGVSSTRGAVQHFTRESAPQPPRPGEPSELEYIASRVFGTRDPEAVERLRHGHAVLGSDTNDAIATGLTSGSTDWPHGLAGRDPQIEQITRDVLTRLGAPR